MAEWPVSLDVTSNWAGFCCFAGDSLGTLCSTVDGAWAPLDQCHTFGVLVVLHQTAPLEALPVIVLYPPMELVLAVAMACMVDRMLREPVAVQVRRLLGGGILR